MMLHRGVAPAKGSATRASHTAPPSIPVAPRPTQPAPSPLAWAATTAAALALVLAPPPLPASALGLESIDFLPDSLGPPSASDTAAKRALDEADATFKSSNTLKELLARSEANKEKNRKAIAEKYCYRQAELGIGDCGGLSLIPGMTESGKQKTPQWLADLLGMEQPVETAPTKTIKDFFKD